MSGFVGVTYRTRMKSTMRCAVRSDLNVPSKGAASNTLRGITLPSASRAAKWWQVSQVSLR